MKYRFRVFAEGGVLRIKKNHCIKKAGKCFFRMWYGCWMNASFSVLFGTSFGGCCLFIYPGCRVLHVLLFEVYTKISKKTLNNFYICRSSLCDIAFYLSSKALQRCLGFFTGVSSNACVSSDLFCLFLTVHRCDWFLCIIACVVPCGCNAQNTVGL